MTQDTDSGQFYTIPPRKSYNPFDSDDDTFESTDLKAPIAFNKEDCIAFDLKTLEGSAEALTFDIDKGEFSWEAALLEKDGQLYTDKNVMECEAPEFIVCCKESSYQSVKDIGIDEGVCVNDKKGGEFDVIKADGLTQEVKTQEDDDSLKIIERKLDLEAEEPCTDEKDTKTAEFADEIDSDRNDFGGGEPDLVEKDGVVHEVEEKENKISTDGVDKIADREPNAGESLSKHPIENGQEKDMPIEVPTMDETSPATSNHAPPMQEPPSTSDSSDSPTNTIPKNHQDDQEDMEAAKPPTPQAMTRHSEPLLEEPVVHSFSSLTAFPPPSSITFSGPVSYSGSISLRSESSAGSTRSFAFPVLQTEWNSSPERMAKAEDRRKRGGWRQALFCCWL